MTTRSELENRLKVFADNFVNVSNIDPGPLPLPVALENASFKRPNPPAPYLECFLARGDTISATVDAMRNRERGVWAVNCYVPSNLGMGLLERIVQGVLDTFRVIPKLGTVSIESPGNTSKMVIDAAGWACIPITFPYRVETQLT